MAKIQVNYGQLLALKTDIEHQQKVSAAFYFFNQSRIQKFYQLNQMALKVMQSRLDEFVTKYVMFDKDQQPVTEERDGQLVYKFYSEEYRQKYIDARNNFLSLKISIEL